METSVSVLGAVKEDIVGRIILAIDKAKEVGELPSDLSVQVKLETPSRPELGDFATGVAMAVGRLSKSDGRTAAGIIVRHLSLEGSPIRQVDIAGPGFLNFFLDRTWLEPAMARIWSEGPAYGTTSQDASRKVCIEFVSANPTGPLNVVNARAAAVGDCLASLMQAAGHEVSREFYINDAGNQAERLADSLDVRIRQIAGEEAQIPEGGYKGEYLIDMAKELLESKGAGLFAMETEERLAFLGKYAMEHIVENQRQVLLDYGLKYDTWFSERSLRDSGAYMEVVDTFQEKGLTYEKDGALWFRSTEFGDDKDRVIVRSDDKASVTYIVPDLAYHKNKYGRGFDLLVDLLGPDHHGYLGRLRAGLVGLGYPKDGLEILIVQMVRLLRTGEAVKMSKRGGDFVTMEELLEEVGKDAARFFFLMRSPESHLDFDMDLARLQSNENPVYYVQYAHARIASIFRQAKEDGVPTSVGPTEVAFALLKDPAEVALMKTLAAFPEEVRDAARAREPNRLVKYMTDVATAFHSFYTKCRVMGEDKELSAARLYLAKVCQIVLANALRLAGISAPEAM